MSENKFSVIIPAFNEEETIENLLKNLQAALADINIKYEIIIVDDGSSDNTFSLANNIPGVRVIRHPYNKGNGAAVKTGIQNTKYENLIILDADGQHKPEYIFEFLKFLEEFDLVVGSRESFGIGKRGFGNFFVSWLASYISGIKIPDLTSGFRAFKKDKMLEFIHLLPNGFSLPSTSTLSFAISGYNIKFIPIIAQTRKGGKSSIKILRDGMKFIVLIVRIISLFKPLKIFTPISLSLFIIGLIWAIHTLTYSLTLTATVAMLFLGSIFIFLFGLLADQIAETRLSLGKINKALLQMKIEPID